MATPIAELIQRNRRALSKAKRELVKIQEAITLLVNEDADTCDVRQQLEEQEIDLISHIETIGIELDNLQKQLHSHLNDPTASPPYDFGTPLDEDNVHADPVPDMHAMHVPKKDVPQVKSAVKFDIQQALKKEAPQTQFTLTLQSLTRIDLPTLTESISLRQHFQRVERILLECGGARRGTNGVFEIAQHLQHSILSKFAKSLQVPSVKRSFEHLADYEPEWETIKSRLIERYCDSHTLYQEYKGHISRLTWTGEHDVGDFVERVRDIWRIGRIINTNAGLEQKTLYDRTRELIGPQLFEQVLKRLAIANTIEWEFQIPLEKFLTALATEAKYAVLASSGNKSQNKRESHDRVRAVSGEQRFRSFNSRQNGITQFRAADYKNTLVLTPLKPVDEIRPLKQVLADHPASDIKEFTRRNGSKGMFLGFNDATKYATIKDILTSTTDLMVRDFDPDYKSKSPTATAPKVRDGVRRAARLGDQHPVEYFVNGKVRPLGASAITDGILLVDSGAGYSYITTMDTRTRDQLERQKAITAVDEPFLISMADGSHVQVSEQVTAEVSLHALEVPSVAATTAELQLFILPSAPSDNTEILLGSTAINALDLVVGRGGVSTASGIRLMDSGYTEHITPRDSVRLIAHSATTSEHLTGIVDRGWTPLLRSPAYQARLRPIENSDVRDHPEQTHIFEIRIPESAPPDQSEQAILAAEGKARKCHQRLPTSLKCKQDEIIDKYIDRKWWKEASVAECKRSSRFQPVAGFLVGLDGSKPRIVVDFPEVNDTLPESSTPSTMPAQMLACLRLHRASCVVISDISSAFYKVRLEKDFLWITVASTINGRVQLKHYLSPRVVFGILFGPSALISTLAELFSVHQKLAPQIKSFSGWYIDDNICAGTPQEVSETMKWVVVTLRRVGHELQFSKCAAICHPAIRDELTQMLKELGDINIVDHATIFQTSLSYTPEGFLVTACANKNRKLALTALADDTLKSKGDFASLCGTLSYDIVRNHPQERAIADAFRSLIGKEFNHISDWDLKLNMATLSKEKQECFKLLKNWSRELLQEDETDAPCQHLSPVSSQPCRQPILHLYVDASIVGGGHVLCCDLMQYPIWTDNYRWKASECRWHINVMELQAVNRALRSLADLLECFCRSTRNIRPLVHIYCDNKSAVKWSTLNSRELLNKHQSRRTIIKLVDEIAEEWKIIQSIADTTLQLLPGHTNTIADQLSRLYHRKLTPESDMNLNELLEFQTVPSTDEPHHILQLIENQKPLTAHDNILDDLDMGYSLPILDTLRAIRNPPIEPDAVNLIDSLAGQCCDMIMLHDRMKLGINILRAWKSQLNRNSSEMTRFDPTSQEIDIRIGKCAQINLDRSTLPHALRDDTGPLFHDGQTETLLYRSPLPSGQYETLPFIPKQAKRLTTLLIRDAHRKACHMGADYTISKLHRFVIQRLRPQTHEFLRTCLFCQRKNAYRQAKSAFTMIHNRERFACYQSIAIDMLSLGDQIDVLVVTCLMSGHTMLSHCKTKSALDIAVALKRVIYRVGVAPQQVLADAAVNLSAAVEQIRREFLSEIQFSPTSAHSQFENGKLERLNAIAVQITQYKSHFHKLDLSKLQDDLQRQDLFDYLSYHLNQRPLGPHYVSDGNNPDTRILITPHSLMHGSNLLSIVESKYIQQNSWKTYFYDHCWRVLKRRSEANIRGRAARFYIGEPVLYYAPSKKSIVPWRMGHIADVINKRVKIRSSEHSRFEFEMNEYNVVPLRYYNPTTADNVTRVDARISYMIEDTLYYGTVIEETDEGLLVIGWDPVHSRSTPTTWPPEMLPPSAVTIIPT